MADISVSLILNTGQSYYKNKSLELFIQQHPWAEGIERMFAESRGLTSIEMIYSNGGAGKFVFVTGVPTRKEQNLIDGLVELGWDQEKAKEIIMKGPEQ
jgi:hypothetical protein